MRPLNIGIDKALEKIRHFCAYQERSHREARDKLYSFGLYKNEVEQLMAELVEDNYLNEERFAIAFAGGRFRMKHWGRIKIRYELQQRGVSSFCIKLALAAIPESDYNKRLEQLALDKLKTLKSEKNIFIKKKKLQSYLLQKGYEPVLVSDFVNDV